jgi:SAM-dependent methyltransferase
VSLIGHLFSFAPVRKAIWRRWYPYLTRRLRGEGVVFLNYAFEEAPPMNLPLAAGDEVNRACIQLYYHVAAQAPLREKRVLEVSCGHGGGAAYLTRTLQPEHYTALDLNPAGIAFCREQHRVAGLEFVQGDAEHLPFGPETFDAVINIEASHCYPDFSHFLAEVARVLRPGGYFLYADFRFRERWAEWDAALSTGRLELQHTRNINAEVLRGMEQNSARSEALVARHLPKFLRGLGRDFAGTRGSQVYNALAGGELSYRSYCFAKPASPATTGTA